MRYTLDGRLFMHKLLVLVFGTFLFVPLLYLKHHGFALAYLGGLLLLHIVLFFVWFHHIPWRQLLRHKTEFIVRFVAVAFFIYLLTIVHFEGSLLVIVRNTTLALLIHVGILLGIMVHRVPAKAPAKRAGLAAARKS